MPEPKRKARGKRAVGADPLAGLDGDRLAGLLPEDARPRGAQEARTAEPPPKRVARRGKRSPRAAELELALDGPAETAGAAAAGTAPPVAPQRKAEAPMDAAGTPDDAGGETLEDTLPAPAPRDPVEPDAVVRAARALAGQGRNGQAAALLERALAGPARSPEVAVELGRARLKAGAYNEADDALQRAIRLDPKSGAAHLEMGILQSKKGLYGNAIHALREALGLGCDPARGHYYLGICLNQLDRVDEAQAAFEDAVAADPAFDRAWYQLGIVWDRKGDLERAREMYRQARRVGTGARG